MNRRAVAAAGAIVVMLAAAAVTVSLRHRERRVGSIFTTSSQLRAPEGVRIRVQVLNSTKTKGLARRATQLLRDRGFDVVEMGTVSSARDSSVVLDLSGHPEWAQRVAAIIGSARVETRPDSSRYLDIAVLIGSTWHPPAEPFYP